MNCIKHRKIRLPYGVLENRIYLSKMDGSYIFQSIHLSPVCLPWHVVTQDYFEADSCGYSCWNILSLAVFYCVVVCECTCVHVCTLRYVSVHTLKILCLMQNPVSWDDYFLFSLYEFQAYSINNFSEFVYAV